MLTTKYAVVDDSYFGPRSDLQNRTFRLYIRSLILKLKKMKNLMLKAIRVYERLRTQWFIRKMKGEEAVQPPVAIELVQPVVGPQPKPERRGQSVVSRTVTEADPSTTAPSSVQTLMKELEQFFEMAYEFRFNAISETNEYRRKGSAMPFRLLGEREENTICIEAHQQGIACWDRDVRRYVRSLLIPSYHPIHQYMDGLPVWDGQDRVEALARRVSDEPLWVSGFHIWLRALTAQWMEMDHLHGNSVAPVLISRRQGRHKSTFCKLLMPDALQMYYTDHYDLNAQGGAVQKLASFGLINLDEMDKYSDKKMTTLKNIMQMPSINIRKAYKKNYAELPRIASFIGTSNQTSLLTDPTGSRRFLCIEVKSKIDVSTIDHTQLYAQLKAELLAGQPYWFTTDEESALLLHNAPYQKIGMEHELFQSLYRIPEVGEEAQWIPAFKLYERLRSTHSSIMRGVTTTQFGRMLVSMGVEKKKGKQCNLYRLMEVEIEKAS